MKTMKEIGLTILLTILMGNASCASSQSADDQAIKMLEEFYIQYNSIWSGDDDPSNFKTKIFSLQEKYCSEELLKEVRVLFDEYGFDHDLLINDLYGNSVTKKSIKIEKVSESEHRYVVSYPADISEPSKPNETTIVRLNVEVIKEGNSFKLHKVW
jgi:hypothetical protein